MVNPKFKDLCDRITQRQELGHALLLYGNTGSFLKEAAEYFCQSLHPTNKIAASPDHIELHSESRIVLSQIRDIQEQIKYGPSHNTYLTVVIHHCEKFTTEAANAFLKTLEEPPAGVIFILHTQAMDSLLPTIRSRCQTLFVPQIPEPELIKANQNLGNLPTYLLKYQLEDPTLSLEGFQLDEIVRQSDFDKLFSAEQLAEDKSKLSTILQTWLDTLLHSTLSPNAIDNAALITETLSRLRYNLNTRLLIENLVLNLKPY